MGKNKDEHDDSHDCDCENHSDSIPEIDFTEEEKQRCAKMYSELCDVIARFKNEKNEIDIHLAVIPLASVMSSMFLTFHHETGRSIDEMITAFSSLIKHNIDAQIDIMGNTNPPEGKMGHA